MKLSQKQQIFSYRLAQLIIWGFKNGYNISVRQVQRPLAMQLLYFFGFDIIEENNSLKLVTCKKRSKTLKSKHLQCLAADVVLYINGKYITDKNLYRPLGEKWEELGGTWGGRFSIKPEDYATKIGWDSQHFQY